MLLRLLVEVTDEPTFLAGENRIIELGGARRVVADSPGSYSCLWHYSLSETGS
jgi:hypothetical protein